MLVALIGVVSGAVLALYGCWNLNHRLAILGGVIAIASIVFGFVVEGTSASHDRAACEAKGGEFINTRDGHWCVQGVIE
jgi:hypothetical protein